MTRKPEARLGACASWHTCADEILRYCIDLRRKIILVSFVELALRFRQRPALDQQTSPAFAIEDDTATRRPASYVAG